VLDPRRASERAFDVLASRVSPENEALYQPAIDEIVLEKGRPKATP
jgi:hypothetical protein